MLVAKNDNLSASIQGEDPNLRATITRINVILVHRWSHQKISGTLYILSLSNLRGYFSDCVILFLFTKIKVKSSKNKAE